MVELLVGNEAPLDVAQARLAQLADYLEAGNLGHREFNFRHVNISVKEGEGYCNPVGTCGTAGCALGELPFVFPEDWEFPSIERGASWGAVAGEVALKDVKINSAGMRTSFAHATRYFRLTESQVDHLFAPCRQDEIYGGTRLGGDATPQQVAANIRAFIAWRNNQ